MNFQNICCNFVRDLMNMNCKKKIVSNYLIVDNVSGVFLGTNFRKLSDNRCKLYISFY